jgi:putative ATPase
MDTLAFGDERPSPLADRMRPRRLDEVVGQTALLGAEGPLRTLIERDRCRALLFWGPPGSGKTTVGRIIAERSGAPFVHLSAALSGVKDVREVLDRSAERCRLEGRRDLLFLDEIHRFNRAQQDVLLSHLEAGTVLFIGATTENPSFALTSALLSRCQLFCFAPLDEDALRAVVVRAVEQARGLGGAVDLTEEAVTTLIELCDGDARRALNALELAASIGVARRLDATHILRAVQRKALQYDRAGEEHYNVISALHKSIRNSDADASLYWLARMLDAGEDPRFIARRLIRMASEDIGLADPRALSVALAAREAVEWIGVPECNLALAEAAVYLAMAPKSNALYIGLEQAAADVQRHGNEPVPLHLRNAPTGLMKQLGYGRGYQYAHDLPEGVASMRCLPKRLAARRYYRPSGRGFERALRRRLDALRRRQKDSEHDPGAGERPSTEHPHGGTG